MSTSTSTSTSISASTSASTSTSTGTSTNTITAVAILAQAVSVQRSQWAPAIPAGLPKAPTLMAHLNKGAVESARGSAIAVHSSAGLALPHSRMGANGRAQKHWLKLLGGPKTS